MRWIVFILLYALPLQGQYTLAVDCPSCAVEEQFERKFNDSLSLLIYLRKKQLNFLGQGFAEASFDNITKDSFNYRATLHLGDTYTLALLDLEAIPAILRPQNILKSKTAFSPYELKEYLQTIIQTATQHGYPMAQVYLKDITYQNNNIKASVLLEKGYYTQYGKVKTIGNTGIKNSFIHHYLRIIPGKPFNINHLHQIEKRINELDFMTLTAPPNIRIYGEEAIISLVLKEKKANQFNFLIGILPNNTETQKLLLVGNVLMDFKNMLGYGERFYFKFDQIRPQTQQLALKVNFPYPLSLPVGLAADFDLYKRDTSFIDINSELAAQYFLKPNDYLKFFWHNKRSNLLTINKTQLILSKKLPINLDYRSNLFGLEYGLSKLDYRFNPRKGLAFSIQAGAGFIHRPQNLKITEIKVPNKPESYFAQLYDSLGTKTWQLKSSAHFKAYLPIFNSSVLAFHNATGWVYTPSTPRQNELYRIGGNRLLRGFDEESIFASLYNVSSLEYRLLIGQRSYLFAFGDYGWVQSPDYQLEALDYTQTHFVGFGAGMSFETKSGNFKIGYALGKQGNNPIDTRSSKIHLGYQSVF